MNKDILPERSREILKCVVRTYIATGNPVSSHKIARMGREEISPATVRNVMAELERSGYLMQPHTSAGRVPTDKGYRFYVDALLERRRLSSAQIQRINRSLLAEDTIDSLMMRASHLLSSITNNVGFVLSPSISHVRIKHIEFLKLYDGKILAIIVSQSGAVQKKVVPLDEELTQEELNQASRFLADKFKGKNLITIRNELLQMIREERALYDRLMAQALCLAEKSLADVDAMDAEVYVEGASNFIGKPEFADIERLRELLRTFEEKERLVKLISECIREDVQKVTVRIGSENHLRAMEDCTLIASPYTYEDRVVGTLGILGPKRMEYGRAIAIVDYVAKLFSKILNSHPS